MNENPDPLFLSYERGYFKKVKAKPAVRYISSGNIITDFPITRDAIEVNPAQASIPSILKTSATVHGTRLPQRIVAERIGGGQTDITHNIHDTITNVNGRRYNNPIYLIRGYHIENRNGIIATTTHFPSVGKVPQHLPKSGTLKGYKRSLHENWPPHHKGAQFSRLVESFVVGENYNQYYRPK